MWLGEKGSVEGAAKDTRTQGSPGSSQPCEPEAEFRIILSEIGATEEF